MIKKHVNCLNEKSYALKKEKDFQTLAKKDKFHYNIVTRRWSDENEFICL